MTLKTARARVCVCVCVCVCVWVCVCVGGGTRVLVGCVPGSSILLALLSEFATSSEGTLLVELILHDHILLLRHVHVWPLPEFRAIVWFLSGFLRLLVRLLQFLLGLFLHLWPHELLVNLLLLLLLLLLRLLQQRLLVLLQWRRGRPRTPHTLLR